MKSFKMGFPLSLLVLMSVTVHARTDLQFGTDGKFQIVQFTDIHWEYWLDNQQSLDAMSSVLDIEQPELVVLTGDIVPRIYGEESFLDESLTVACVAALVLLF